MWSYLVSNIRLVSINPRLNPIQGIFVLLILVVAPCLLQAQPPCSQCSSNLSACNSQVSQTHDTCTQNAQDTQTMCVAAAQSGYPDCLNECLSRGGGSNCAPSCNAEEEGTIEGCNGRYDGVIQGCTTGEGDAYAGCSAGYSACYNGPPHCV
jgi:hypothetical protein